MKVFVHKGTWERLQAIGEASGASQRVDIVVVIGNINQMLPDPEDRQLWVEIKPQKNIEDAQSTDKELGTEGVIALVKAMEVIKSLQEEAEDLRVDEEIKRDNMGEPENTAGMKFLAIKSISIREWHRLPDGRGKPEQVHLMLEVEGIPYPLILRFKRRRPVDELIVALMEHANSVWGKVK